MFNKLNTKINALATRIAQEIKSLSTKVNSHEQTITRLNNQAERGAAGFRTYVQSRASGLISNGFGLLKDNTNFSGFSFDASKGHLGMGAFVSSVRNHDTSLDELIPIIPDVNYQLSFWMYGNGGANNKCYFYMACYDIDERPITPLEVPLGNFRVESFNAGHKSFIIDPVDRAAFQLFYNQQKTVGGALRVNSYEYTSATGKKYPAGTYSREAMSNLCNWNTVTYDQSTGIVSAPGMSLTKTVEAGSYISCCTSSGTYLYPLESARDSIIPTEPTHYKYSFNVDSVPMNNLQRKVLSSAAFFKIGWLLNRGAANGHQTYIYAVDLRIDTNPVFSKRTQVVKISDHVSILIRESKGSSGGMVTGVQVNGTWYGDAPTGAIAINTFT